MVLAAPTGTAAKNIGGLTIHSAFNMPFGNEFISMSDKVRDEKRQMLSEMKLLIIDEFSMVKADMLYLLNLRLKEIKQNDMDFGNIGVILLKIYINCIQTLIFFYFQAKMFSVFQMIKKSI